MTARTALHAAHESAPQQQLYIEGITDDFLFVTLVTLGSLLPFLWLLRRRRHTPEPPRHKTKPCPCGRRRNAGD